MKKADYKFHRDRREQIENNARQNEGLFSLWREPSNRPIFIPKNKKKSKKK